jgi:DNA-binding MarR family transcriptional regulator
MTSMPTRSDADLGTALRISVSRLARRLRVERAAAAGQTDPVLSDTQFAALATLERHGPMSPGELAGHERVQPPSMTRVIAALEAWELVSREAHASDRRQVVLTATQRGRDLVARARRRRDAWLAKRLTELTPQERAMLRAAAPILEKLSQA